ncbi:MAG: serine protease [Bauldia sp.]|nr:serine protease [Bauldia sp.]
MIVGALMAIVAGPAAAQQVDGGFPVDIIPALKAQQVTDGGDPTRILGGDVAGDGAWPWQVGLVSTDASSVFEGQFCGGSFITSRWVLTAAHCVYEEHRNGTQRLMEPEEFSVLAGTNVLLDGEGDMIPVDLVIPHANYNPVLFENDIALVRLARPAQGVAVSTIRLSTQSVEGNYARPGTEAIVTGWGRLEDGTYPIDLRQVAITVFDTDECNRAVIEEDPISENMICSGALKGGIGSCSGDSGGPLIVALPDGDYMQVGVVSWGYTSEDSIAGCDLTVDFSAYARVARYQDWIRNAIVSAN